MRKFGFEYSHRHITFWQKIKRKTWNLETSLRTPTQKFIALGMCRVSLAQSSSSERMPHTGLKSIYAVLHRQKKNESKGFTWRSMSGFPDPEHETLLSSTVPTQHLVFPFLFNTRSFFSIIIIPPAVNISIRFGSFHSCWGYQQLLLSMPKQSATYAVLFYYY